ncbi:MAG: class I SAM-dependent methyltransferase [Candidatus Omnitrophota bacterium]|jgi:SAM-dependent methyltransferase
MRILDLGCGNNKAPGSIGVDISVESRADVLCNLNIYPLPFKNNSFDGVVSKQVFEHLDDVEKLMHEIHRITKDKAIISVYVPHFSCFFSYGDPSHKRTFSVFAFDKISQRCGFRVLSKKITFHRAIRRYMLDCLFNRFPVSYERFWAFIFPAEHLIFKFETMK